MSKLFETSLLLEALESKNERVAVWGAYQMLLLEPEELRLHIDLLLYSDFWEIVEAGLTKVAELKVEICTPLILKLFRDSNGPLKNTAAYSLSQFPHDISKLLLQRWFEQLTASNYTTRLELESAVYAYIRIDPPNHLSKVLAHLPIVSTDIIKSVILLVTALPFCTKNQEIKQVFNQYFILRDLYSDTELTYQLILHYGDIEIQEWISDQLANGYRLQTVFEKCYDLLGLQASLLERRCWQEMDQVLFDTNEPHASKPKDYNKLIVTLTKLGEHLMESLSISSQSQVLIQILHLFEQNQELLAANIPKIIHLEYHFLLSIPFLILLDFSLSKWFSRPNQYLRQIADYYHSNLLTTRYREDILALFFSSEPDWPVDNIPIIKQGYPLDQDSTKAEILWDFYRGEYLGFDIEWPIYFPNPGTSGYLVNGLFKIYYTNFDYYVKKGNTVAVDYALSLFQVKPEIKAVFLLLTHFDYLYRFHGEMLLQTIEYIPSPDFFNILISNYQTGEYETAELILFLSEIYQIPLSTTIENSITKDLALKPRKSGIKKRIRLYCDNCSSVFQYIVDQIFIDEGSIYKSGQLSMNSIWIPKKIFCKKCSEPVTFQLDKVQLENLTAQSRIDRITQHSNLPQTDNLTLAVVLIEFPRFRGQAYNPEEFEEFVLQLEQKSQIDQLDFRILRMKLARIYQVLHRWKDSAEVLSSIQPDQHLELEWRFLLGLAGFKLEDFALAKQHFDWVIARFKNNSWESMEIHFAEQAQYFLEQMTSYESKRARFKIINKKT